MYCLAMDAQDVWKNLIEYRDKLNEGDWSWVIPRQDSIGNIVGKLIDAGIVWPVMSGSYWPKDYPVVQLQWVETAIFNLETDPTLAERLRPKDPWILTAERLEEVAASMSTSDWIESASEAQQLVAVVNPSAADQIGDLIEKHSVLGSADYPDARERVVGVIRGAATRARLHGPAR